MTNIYKNTVLAAILAVSVYSTQAQSTKCNSMNQLAKQLKADPSLAQRMAETEARTQAWISSGKKPMGVITIPTVVHVIYGTDSQNVSDMQIFSQLATLNADFRKMNPDSLASSHAFYANTGDAQIEFCLAQMDPAGNPTTGITRTSTAVKGWPDGEFDKIKSTADGGKDNWDPTKYLNLYVVALEGTTLGFASFPDELASSPSLDGVVIRYEAFGSIGTAGTGGFDVNNGGRTATHEVGHWLNLRHIWGDTTCGDDMVPDTEIAEDANYGCPTFPHRANGTCGQSANGEMYMNYMDYVDDNCMHMFTAGQVARMQAALNGPRSGLLNQQVCNNPTGMRKATLDNSIELYPNPAKAQLNLQINTAGTYTAQLVDLTGRGILRQTVVAGQANALNTSAVAPGVYYLQVTDGVQTAVKRVMISE